MLGKTFAVREQGDSHKKRNQPCQDYVISEEYENYLCAVVADGHGGSDYVRSDRGAKIICEVVSKHIKALIQHIESKNLNKNQIEENLKVFKQSIIKSWREMVERDWNEFPLSKEEKDKISLNAIESYEKNDFYHAYGTTLLTVVLTNNFCIALQKGDGKCVALKQSGEFFTPVPWDERCFLNVTTSICDDDAAETMQDIVLDGKDIPAAFLLGSDGVDDSFRTEDQLFNFYRTILYSFSNDFYRNNNIDYALKELKSYLPRFSAKGSGDDVSIAAIINMEKIKDIEEIFNFNEEEARNKLIEAAKLEKEKAENERKHIAEKNAINKKQREERVAKMKS